MPVAAQKSVDLQSYDPRNLVEFATQIKTLNHVLVVGHSNTTPELLRLMGGQDINIEESDYGVVNMLQKHGLDMTTQSIHIPLK